MKKKLYKEYLYKVLCSWLVDQANGDTIEDHHLVVDIVRLLECDREFAVKTVQKLINDERYGRYIVRTLGPLEIKV